VFRLNNLILILLLIFVLLGCSKEQAEIQSPGERGKYLIALGGCNDCHTPKTPEPNSMPVFDSSKLLSGHLEKSPVPSWSPEDNERKVVVAATNGALTAWAGPWGVVSQLT
jgi:PBP1b-binding outer membrane lipoprotein LpoB